MSFLVETEEGTWELPDRLKSVVVTFMQALESSDGLIKFHPSGSGSMSEIVVPRILNVGPRKIMVIKELRAAYGIGLKEAKDKSEEPTPIRLGPLPLHRALEVQRFLQEAGATVELPNALDRLARI